MNKGFKYWLRWFVVLPGALIASVLSTFPLHIALYSTLSNFIEPYPELPERLLSPFVMSAVFIWAGSQIAPDYKVRTSLILFGLWMLLFAWTVYLVLTGGAWMGSRLYFNDSSIAPIMAIAGALTGIYIVRRNI